MTNPGWKHRFALAAASGLLGLAVAAGAGTPAWANDEEEDVSFDTKIIRQFMSGLGLRRDGGGIDYRERSPLVVPPSRSLPSPETGSTAEKTAAWPVDPDVKRSKELKAARKKPTKTVDDESRPELPSQLGPRAKTAPPNQIPTPGPHVDPTKPSSLSELNARSFWSLGGLISPKEEYATFGGEPARSSLTEPPPGYRTPSPTHAYGVGKGKGAGALNPMDHASGQQQ